MFNRRMADAFAVINLVFFAIALVAAIGGGMWAVVSMQGSGVRGMPMLMALGMPLFYVLWALIFCGLGAVLVEIMRSLRTLEQQAARLGRAVSVPRGGGLPSPSQRRTSPTSSGEGPASA